jgi:hypothetical protein
MFAVVCDLVLRIINLPIILTHHHHYHGISNISISCRHTRESNAEARRENSRTCTYVSLCILRWHCTALRCAALLLPLDCEDEKTSISNRRGRRGGGRTRRGVCVSALGARQRASSRLAHDGCESSACMWTGIWARCVSCFFLRKFLLVWVHTYHVFLVNSWILDNHVDIDHRVVLSGSIGLPAYLYPNT